MIAIILATYNGEKYIREQIDSIIQQSYRDWKLYIRDDCSTDMTQSILDSYAQIDERITIIPNNNQRLGITGNFNEILSKISDEEYIMCSDQDDVWFDNKILKSFERLKAIENEYPNQPALVFTNSILTDSNLKPLGKNLYPHKFKLGLNHFLFMNAGYQGASMIFNKNLLSFFLPFPQNLRVHDYYISLSAYLNGHIGFIRESYAYYRRHPKATNQEYITFIDRLKGFFLGRPRLYNNDMHLAIKTYIAQNTINEKDRRLLTDYFSITSKNISLWKKCRLIYRNNFTLRNSRLYLLFKLIILG